MKNKLAKVIANKIIEGVKRIDLNLTGKTVLTEVASNQYMVTSLLAAYAGAKVYAYGKDTRYGLFDDIVINIKSIVSELDRSIDIKFLKELTPIHINQADIITNSGHLRPLNSDFLKHTKKGVVIPLMYESWEFRGDDIDLKTIRELDIRLGGTNERHSDVDVFNYLGDMCLKLILDSGSSLYNNKFILLCNNDFGPYIAKSISEYCELLVIDLDSNKSKYDGLDITWQGGFPNAVIPTQFRNAEAVVFTAYPFTDQWIGGDNTPIKIQQLVERLKNPKILRYAGDIEINALEESSIQFYPEHVTPGHMGILPSDIGFDPIIRLQAGGLKVGQLMREGNTHFREQELVQIIN